MRVPRPPHAVATAGMVAALLLLVHVCGSEASYAPPQGVGTLVLTASSTAQDSAAARLPSLLEWSPDWLGPLLRSASLERVSAVYQGDHQPAEGDGDGPHVHGQWHVLGLRTTGERRLVLVNGGGTAPFAPPVSTSAPVHVVADLSAWQLPAGATVALTTASVRSSDRQETTVTLPANGTISFIAPAFSVSVLAAPLAVGAAGAADAAEGTVGAAPSMLHAEEALSQTARRRLLAPPPPSPPSLPRFKSPPPAPPPPPPGAPYLNGYTTLASSIAASQASARQELFGKTIKCAIFRTPQMNSSLPPDLGDGFATPINASLAAAWLALSPTATIQVQPQQLTGANIWVAQMIANATGLNVQYYLAALPQSVLASDDVTAQLLYVFNTLNMDCVLNGIFSAEYIQFPYVNVMHPHQPVGFQIVAMKPLVQFPPYIDDLFTWAKPFTPRLWALIAGSLVLCAFSMELLEGSQGGDFEDCEDFWDRIKVSVYLATLGYTGQVPFYEARSTGGRIYSALLGVSIFIIIALYTGALAAYLSTPPVPLQAISSVINFADSNKPCCVLNRDTHIAYMRENHPGIPLYIVDSTSTPNLLQAILNGTCDGGFSTDVDLAFAFSRSQDPKGHFCMLQAVGPVLASGFYSLIFSATSTAVTFPMVAAMSELVGVAVYQGTYSVNASNQFFPRDQGQCAATDAMLARQYARATSLSLHSGRMAGIFAILACATVVALYLYVTEGIRARFRNWLLHTVFPMIAARKKQQHDEKKKRQDAKKGKYGGPPGEEGHADESRTDGESGTRKGRHGRKSDAFTDDEDDGPTEDQINEDSEQLRELQEQTVKDLAEAQRALQEQQEYLQQQQEALFQRERELREQVLSGLRGLPEALRPPKKQPGWNTGPAPLPLPIFPSRGAGSPKRPLSLTAAAEPPMLYPSRSNTAPRSPKGPSPIGSPRSFPLSRTSVGPPDEPLPPAAAQQAEIPSSPAKPRWFGRSDYDKDYQGNPVV